MEHSIELSPDPFSNPRSAKRRKVTTYTLSRSTPKSTSKSNHRSNRRQSSANTERKDNAPQSLEINGSPQSASVFQKLSGAVSGIGQRLFEPAVSAGLNGQDETTCELESARSTHTTGSIHMTADPSDSDDDRDELSTENHVGTPVSVKTAPRVDGKIVSSHFSEHGNGENSSATRSGGRQRRKPRRYSQELVKPTMRKETDKMQPERKGILTPSKRKKGERIRKSVTFQGENNSSDLAFEDITPKDRTSQQTSSSPGLVHDPSPENQGETMQTPEDLQAGLSPALKVPDLVHDTVLGEPTIAPPARDPDVENLRSVLLSRLTHRSLNPIVGLSNEYQKVCSILSQTVTAGEGNSMLILGSRGVGKTLLVETAITELQQEHADTFHTIRLNGLFQTDDKLALKEIWRQLGREMDIDQDENQVGSYADTLSSLLALLSHPEELFTTDNEVPGNYAHGVTAKSVVFVMDEFDLFASHSRQTLLYNLFDIAQARKAPIAVIGLTTRLDVADYLEKRVKSRFSQRYLFVPAAKNLDAFKETCKATLIVSSTDKCPSGAELDAGIVKRWNAWVDQLFNEDEDMTRHLTSIFTTSKSLPDFHRSCLLPISRLNTSQLYAFPTGSDFITAGTALSAPDNILSELPALPHLQLALLVCAARFDAIYTSSTSGLDSIAVNFESVYAEYVRLSSDARIASSASGSLVASGSSRIWGRGSAEVAWDELIERGLFVETGGKGKEKNVRVEVSLDEIAPGVEGGGGKIPDEVKKWCKEI